MKKNTFLTIIALYIVDIFAIGVAYRFIFKPITENIPHDALLAWVYDLVLLCFLIQAVFLGLILIILIYSMTPTQDSIPEEKEPKSEKLKKEQKQKSKKSEPKPKKEKQKDKDSQDESEFTKQWRKLEREAK